MRRDAIFYTLFKQSPSLLFDLLEAAPSSAAGYRFESVTVKEPTFLIDGVFLPPEGESPGVVFFAEVQMQKVDQLYERLFAESMAYFYRNRGSFSDWQAVVIYASRSTEQDDTHPYRVLINSAQVHRIYLNELGDIETLPLGVASMVLTIVKEAEAAEKARMLIGRVNQEVSLLPITILRTVHRYILLSPRLKPHPGPLLAKEREIFWWLKWLGLNGDKPMQQREICPLSLARRGLG
jgi:predicted transposase/invertase (TIGR01784 family)